MAISSLSPLEYLRFLQQTVESLMKIGVHLPIEVSREVVRVARRIEEEANQLANEIRATDRNSASGGQAPSLASADEVTWYRHEAEQLRVLATKTLDGDIGIQLLKKAEVLDLLAEQLTRD